jgi:hypothetical protein
MSKPGVVVYTCNPNYLETGRTRAQAKNEKQNKKAGGARVIECLFWRLEALSSNPSNGKRERETSSFWSCLCSPQLFMG